MPLAALSDRAFGVALAGLLALLTGCASAPREGGVPSAPTTAALAQPPSQQRDSYRHDEDHAEAVASVRPSPLRLAPQVRLDPGHALFQELALDYLGIPYRRGGSSLATGVDCSYLIYHLYRRATGLHLPRSAAEQAQATEPVPLDGLRAGDLLFFRYADRRYGHVAVYMGDGVFLHAGEKDAQVTTDELSKPYWLRRLTGIRRVLPGRRA